jgi:excisionase family DNA binding protein
MKHNDEGVRILELYTIEEVAQKLKVHDRTVRRYIKSGDLKAVNLGSESQPNWRIQDIDFLAFLEKKKTGKKGDE